MKVLSESDKVSGQSIALLPFTSLQKVAPDVEQLTLRAYDHKHDNKST